MRALTLLLSLLLYVQDTAFNEKDLYGAWRWVRSSGGIWDHTITPEKAGETKKIILTKDHHAMYYTNDSLALRINYMILKEKSLFADEPVPVLRLTGLIRTQIISLLQDTLYLRDNAYDGYAHVYVRFRD